jgi:hypothetical protein
LATAFFSEEVLAMRPADVLVVSVALMLSVSSATARTWHIQPDGSGDASTIQAGIDSAAVGDTIELGCGIYNETVIFLKSGVTVRSATGDPDCAIIDALGAGRIFAADGVDATTSLEGLTLRSGSASSSRSDGSGGAISIYESSPVVRDCVFDENSSSVGGGAVSTVYVSSPRFERCEFRSNSSDRGGAVQVATGGQAVFQECRFLSNHANRDGGGMYLVVSATVSLLDCEFRENSAGQRGGAIYCWHSEPTFAGCSFIGNEALQSGGGAFIDNFERWLRPTFSRCGFEANVSGGGGGGIAVDEGSVAVEDCEFTGNTAANEGGGAYCVRALSVDLPTNFRRCRFTGNTANHGGGLYRGLDQGGQIEECTFIDNEATGVGGGLMLKAYWYGAVRECLFVRNKALRGGAIACWEWYHQSSSIESCTISENEAGEGAGVYVENSTALIATSILAFNRSGPAVGCGVGAEPTFTCSDLFGNAGGDWIECIADQYGADGNFTADPLFCGPDFGDFTLRSDSPCLPGNHPDGYDCGLIGALGEGCGGTAVERTTWGSVKSMFR